MAKDLFAPPTDEELKMFAPPTDEELGQGEEPSIYQKFLDKGKSALQTGEDLAQGAGKSMLSTQIVPAMTASAASLTGTAPDLSWAEKYRQAQDLLQQSQKQSQERSPIAFKTGEIGGIIAPSLLTGGAAAGVRGVAPSLGEKVLAGTVTGAGIGGLQGASTSEGHLIDSTPEERKQLGRDTAEGVITGGIVGGGLSLAAPLVKSGAKAVSSKLGSYIADSPLLRQMGKAKELGEQGINIYSEKAIRGPLGETSGLVHQDVNATNDLVKRIYDVDQQLGQGVGKAIDDATNQGVKVNLTDPMLQSVNTFKALLEKDQTLMADPQANKLYDTIFKMAGDDGKFDASNLTPKEVQSLRSDVIDFVDSIKQKNPEIANLGYQFQKQSGDLLKSTVPDYKVAADRFESFRRLVPETIISGATPVEITGVKLGNLKNDEAKLFGSVRKMIQGSEMTGFGSSDAKLTAQNFLNGLNEFDQSEAQKLKEGLIKQEDMPKLSDTTNESQAQVMDKVIKDKADTSAMLQQAWRINPQETIGTSIKGAVFGKAGAMNLANKYGLAKDILRPIVAPVVLTKRLYNASEDQLRGVAQKMSDIPGLQSIGKTLVQGLDNKDVSGVNAAIFSIMQNPQARILINGDDTLKSEEENK